MAAATAGLCALAALCAAFAADYLGNLRPAPRGIALGTIALAALSIGSRVVSAGPRETLTDLALEIEKRHGLKGDLVAALQFQSDEARGWGSLQLEDAVVEQVEERSRDLDVLEGFSWSPLLRRLLLFIAALAAVLIPAALAPRYASAFMKRLTLADVSYPTRTVITGVFIEGNEVDLAAQSPLRAPAGSALTFAATASGVRPETGVVVLEGDGGGGAEVALRRRSSSSDATYDGTLDAVREGVWFQVRIGDAVTPPRRIEVVPRPVVAVDLLPVSPTYARESAPAGPPAGVRTAHVLEGSSVALVVRGVNKRLERVMVEVGSQRSQVGDQKSREEAGDESQEQEFALRASNNGRTWRLEPRGTPFESVRQGFDFRVLALDAEGLSPAEVVTGSIRIRADRPPRVAAEAAVTRVLPTGRPQVSYGASDDFGVEEMRAEVTVNRADGTVEQRTIGLAIENGSTNEVRGRQALDLASFELVKGDRVLVTVVAVDDRGERPGESAQAEAIGFEVTDRAGLLASLAETDEESAERLDEIIRRELGISGE